MSYRMTSQDLDLLYRLRGAGLSESANRLEALIRSVEYQTWIKDPTEENARLLSKFALRDYEVISID